MWKGFLKIRKTPKQNGINIKLIKVKVTGQLNCWLDIFKVLLCIDKMVMLCSQGLVTTTKKMRPVRPVPMRSFSEHFSFSFSWKTDMTSLTQIFYLWPLYVICGKRIFSYFNQTYPQMIRKLVTHLVTSMHRLTKRKTVKIVN